MKIEKVTIKNFKGLESVDVTVGGHNVYLVGGNGVGKSSFIDAIWLALTGKKLPSEATKDGAKKGLIEVDLGDYIARLKLSKGKTPTFELEEKGGEEKDGEIVPKLVKAPRTFLNDAIGVIDFDVNQFFGLTGKEQVKYFCNIIGVDFTDLDDKINEAMEQRKLDKKSLELLQKQTNFYDKKLLELELIDVVALSKKIAEDTDKRRNVADVNNGIETRTKRVAEIEQQIHELRQKQFDLNLEIDGANEWLSDKENLPVEEAVIAEWKQQLETATTTNEKIAEAKNFEKIDKQIDTYTSQVEALNTAVEDWRSEKSKRMAKAINVEGLVYDVAGEQFTYNGLPFERNQINTAAQIIAGLKISSALLKELKIVKLDGSLIDKINMKQIKEFAEAQGIELFVEVVDREASKLEIIVED